jgi:hypothetical protein
MKTITAYKCNYCTKIYDTAGSCKSHEYRCYFNPRTQSCASCVCLKYDYYRYNPSRSIAVRTCLKNVNIAEKLQTKCEQYCSNAEDGIMEKINEAERGYNPISFVKAHLKKHGILVKTEIKVDRSFQEINIIE